eukprot:jgi/Botrbrau1/2808/Bobra.0125s0019.1
MPIIAHEFVTEAVPESKFLEPEMIDRRACLFRVLLPPDHLNPLGYYTGEISVFLDRGGRPKIWKGEDRRSIYRPLPLPEQGDPNSQEQKGVHDLRWTIRCDEIFTITVVNLPHARTSLGYIVQEASKVGKLDVNMCEELNVKPGKSFGLLKDGESVLSETGETVHPHQVISPDIEGRRMVILGESHNPSAVADACRGSDLIVAPAHCPGLDGEEAARVAGRFAAEVGAAHLTLGKFTKAYPPENVGPLLRAATDAFGLDRVSVAFDMAVLDIGARKLEASDSVDIDDDQDPVVGLDW